MGIGLALGAALGYEVQTSGLEARLFTDYAAGRQVDAHTNGVLCLTCHRAHATSSPDAGRWDFNVTLLFEDGLEVKDVVEIVY